jgi:hypothetical protein
MNYSRLTASFFALFAAVSGGACGPTESLPPTKDAGVTSDAGDAGPTCDGVCVAHIPLDWNPPALVWMGAKADAPPCYTVASAPYEEYVGYGDPDAPLCGACTCDAPTGSCELPATLTAAASTCATDGSGVAHTSFDAPASWDGTCTAANAIPAAMLCSGAPCVQSITTAPPTLKQSGCLPVEPANNLPPTWKTFVRVCVASPGFHLCGTMLESCAPQPPSSAFKICTLRTSVSASEPCPDVYPEKHIFYDGSVPHCSPCTCGVPDGSSCTGSISIFQNGTCSAPPLQVVDINAKGPKCTDLPPGSALGSKAASMPTYSGGSCMPSGGEPAATVICCIP